MLGPPLPGIYPCMVAGAPELNSIAGDQYRSECKICGMVVLEPLHVGIIPDGNRRWARARGVSLAKAYSAGYRRLREIVEALEEKGARYVTVYALSRDNCTRRSGAEIAVLRELSKAAFRELLKDEKVVSGSLRVIVIGDYSSFDPEVARLARRVMVESRWGGPSTLTILYCYSGQWELEEAWRRRHVPASQAHLPPLDLIIRTGGYSRLSGFLPALADYAELYVTDTLWPDFTREELDKALDWYRRRPRNFGK